eukprot:350246-Chlamydomonas_euryale.AAC.3
MESHCEKLRAPVALGCTCTRPRYALRERPAEMPFDTMRERVFLPTWIILVPVSACWQLLVSATEKNSPTELSPLSTTEGYFHVIDEPVSTCVQLILERAPWQRPRFCGAET